MSIAAETRRAAQRYPFLISGLRAGVINYTAAARFLDIGETAAVAAALRRLAAELPSTDYRSRDLRIRVVSGVTKEDTMGDPLLRVGNRQFGVGDGTWTALSIQGSLDAGFVGAVTERIAQAGVELVATGYGVDRLILVVPRETTADAIRLIEETETPDPPVTGRDGSQPRRLPTDSNDA